MEHFDGLETREPEVREAALMAALPEILGRAKAKAPGFARILKDVDPAAINSRAALAQLPVTRKSTLIDLQRKSPPLGGLAALPPGAAAQLYASPGPIYELEATRGDYWRAARALHAAGFRKGEVVHNAFSYHLSPGGWILHSGARALGCAVIPAGVGNSEQQVQAIDQLRPDGYTGTPDFLKALLDKAVELELDAGSLTKALVGGAALPPSLRRELWERGVSVLQCYATADLGLVAYESAVGEVVGEGMILDEGIIVEIVRPGSGEPVAEGEVGEVVVTTLTPEYPLVRFGTGDLSAVLPGQSACGRTNTRIRGWMGRADQTTKVKGLFVHPEQVAEVQRRHPELLRARLEVEREGQNDVMTLRCEVEAASEGLAAAVERTLVQVCKMKGGVTLCAPGELPNDGKVIADLRSYD